MTKNIQYIIAITLLSLTIISCDKDFEAINENPSQPTSTFMEALFNGVIESLQLTWDGQFYVDNEILYPISQMGALTANDWSNTSLGIDAIWNNYYESLKNIRELERRFDNYEGDQEELVNVRAMTKIVLAYKTFAITDLFGDIPFFDAGKGNQDLDLLKPAYNTQEEIYKNLLEELKQATENIIEDKSATTQSGQPIYSFESYDALFNSDMELWIKFANSLRLRHAMRMVEVDPDYTQLIVSDILNNNLPLLEEGEDVLLRPSALGFLKESTHWSFREHRNLRMGSTMWNAMNGDQINSDPRLSIFFDTNNNNVWAPYPNSIPSGETKPVEGGIPYGSQRDNSYDIKGIDNLYSSFNYYLIRDDLDIPEILMTSSEIKFLKAEAYLRGIGVAQDQWLADTEYSLAISESLKFWNNEANACNIWDTKPNLSNTDIFGYSFTPEVSLSSNDFDLDLIYQQSWINFFRQPRQAFALWRRTLSTPIEGNPSTYYRLKYPASEANFNFDNNSSQISKMGGSDANDVKMWWMK